MSTISVTQLFSFGMTIIMSFGDVANIDFLVSPAISMNLRVEDLL
jgi:hypothetical protein